MSAASSSSSSDCDASNIVDACVAGIKPRTEACGGNDWSCLCSAYTDLATCYNNCPNDPTRSSVQNQVTQFCAAAKASTSSKASGSATATSSSSGSATATGSSASASASGSSTSSGDFDSFSGETSTASSSSSSSTGAAAPMHVPAGGALGLALGIVAML
ncbi:hypothetical protein SLS58_009784 [Diplodia intermedia]|uniref:Gpi anchored serine-threonine rich protein n=1 Tax=Diplodia intermedia TaxID=856260 RepID=A0ABR3TAQ6_9PEZI